jgi:hypothetical protein
VTDALAARIAGVWAAELFDNDLGFPLEVVLADELLRSLSQQESACLARLPQRVAGVRVVKFSSVPRRRAR